MKKSIATASIIITLFLAGCAKQKQSSVNAPPQKQRNWEQVLAAAEKYGLSDTLRNKMDSENGLMYFSTEALELHLTEERAFYDSDAQFKNYLSEAPKAKSKEDYFRLLDVIPIFRVQYFKSEDNYSSTKKRVLNSKADFYIVVRPNIVPYLDSLPRGAVVPATHLPLQ